MCIECSLDAGAAGDNTGNQHAILDAVADEFTPEQVSQGKERAAELFENYGSEK